MPYMQMSQHQRTNFSTQDEKVWLEPLIRVAFLKNLIALYNPIAGTVLDLLVGALLTETAVIHYGPSAIAIEEDPVCFGLAVQRLQGISLLVFEQFGPSYLTVLQTICGKRVGSCVVKETADPFEVQNEKYHFINKGGATNGNTFTASGSESRTSL